MDTDTTTGPPRLELVRHPLRLRMLTVEEVSRPTPRLVRVALGGADFAGFRSDGPADHVKVFFPRAGESEPVVPVLGPNGIVPGDGPRPIARDYTPRHHRLDEGLLELDFVIHDGGHASAWAEHAAVGARLGVAGPRGSHVPTGSFGRLVLIGDETGLPAMQNWLRWVPSGMPVTMVVDVHDQEDVQPLTTAGALDARWIGREPRQDAGALLDAVRDLPPAASPATFHWIAAEATVVERVRRVLVDEREVEPALVHGRGYWKRGTPDHQEPHTD